MCFQAYASASAISLSVLQFLFLDQIIAQNGSARGDPYYGPIEDLCASLPDASRIALFDLCRASYVKRERNVDGVEVHVSNTEIVKERRDIFALYVEAPTPEAWLWRRLSGGSALRVLARGTDAEHGLLRLFQRKGMPIYLRRTAQPEVGPLTFSPKDLQDKRGLWVNVHAYKKLRRGADSLEKILKEKVELDYWLRRQAWWSIRRPGDGEEVWRLLPVFHPTSPGESRYRHDAPLTTPLLVSTRRRLIKCNRQRNSVTTRPYSWRRSGIRPTNAPAPPS